MKGNDVFIVRFLLMLWVIMIGVFDSKVWVRILFVLEFKIIFRSSLEIKKFWYIVCGV